MTNDNIWDFTFNTLGKLPRKSVQFLNIVDTLTKAGKVVETAVSVPPTDTSTAVQYTAKSTATVEIPSIINWSNSLADKNTAEYLKQSKDVKTSVTESLEAAAAKTGATLSSVEVSFKQSAGTGTTGRKRRSIGTLVVIKAIYTRIFYQKPETDIGASAVKTMFRGNIMAAVTDSIKADISNNSLHKFFKNTIIPIVNAIVDVVQDIIAPGVPTTTTPTVITTIVTTTVTTVSTTTAATTTPTTTPTTSTTATVATTTPTTAATTAAATTTPTTIPTTSTTATTTPTTTSTITATTVTTTVQTTFTGSGDDDGSSGDGDDEEGSGEPVTTSTTTATTTAATTAVPIVQYTVTSTATVEIPSTLTWDNSLSDTTSPEYLKESTAVETSITPALQAAAASSGSTLVNVDVTFTHTTGGSGARRRRSIGTGVIINAIYEKIIERALTGLETTTPAGSATTTVATISVMDMIKKQVMEEVVKAVVKAVIDKIKDNTLAAFFDAAIEPVATAVANVVEQIIAPTTTTSTTIPTTTTTITAATTAVTTTITATTAATTTPTTASTVTTATTTATTTTAATTTPTTATTVTTATTPATATTTVTTTPTTATTVTATTTPATATTAATTTPTTATTVTAATTPAKSTTSATTIPTTATTTTTTPTTTTAATTPKTTSVTTTIQSTEAGSGDSDDDSDDDEDASTTTLTPTTTKSTTAAKTTTTAAPTTTATTTVATTIKTTVQSTEAGSGDSDDDSDGSGDGDSEGSGNGSSENDRRRRRRNANVIKYTTSIPTTAPPSTYAPPTAVFSDDPVVDLIDVSFYQSPNRIRKSAMEEEMSVLSATLISSGFEIVLKISLSVMFEDELMDIGSGYYQQSASYLQSVFVDQLELLESNLEIGMLTIQFTPPTMDAAAQAVFTVQVDVEDVDVALDDIGTSAIYLTAGNFEFLNDNGEFSISVPNEPNVPDFTSEAHFGRQMSTRHRRSSSTSNDLKPLLLMQIMTGQMIVQPDAILPLLLVENTRDNNVLKLVLYNAMRGRLRDQRGLKKLGDYYILTLIFLTHIFRF